MTYYLGLIVCSTTLWVGHLSKLVHQEELSDTFGEFGDVVSIDLIPPRGCAFICMHRRQDALRCLEKLKSHKMQGKAITVSFWAVIITSFFFNKIVQFLKTFLLIACLGTR